MKTSSIRLSSQKLVIRFCLWMGFLSMGLSSIWASSVDLVRTPNGGIQPQAVMDSKGVLHLVYYKGNAKAGDLFYIRRESGKTTFSTPIRVNTRLGSAVAMGTIRGAQMALGKDSRVHVVWNGSEHVSMKGSSSAPMFYTRLNDQKTAFEPERDLITFASGIDGGGSVAADAEGNVYVVWHAGNVGEAARDVFLARSTDEGKTFAKEIKANPSLTGACGCCSLRALVDKKGILHIIYRTANENVDRDATLLVSSDQGSRFKSVILQPWRLGQCPMSSFSLTEGNSGILAAWETEGQVYYATIKPQTLEISPLTEPSGDAHRKHPVLAFNSAGETLLAWTEGTGWEKGGSVAWQLYDINGKPMNVKGRAGGVPVWSLFSSFVQPNGTFVIVY